MSRQLTAFGSAATTLVVCLIATETARAQATVNYAVPVEEPMRVAYASGPETSPMAQDAEEPVQTTPASDASASTCDGGTCSSGHQGGRQRSRLGQRMADKWNNHWKPCLQWTHWGYDEFQKPRPLGDAVYGNLQAQVWSGLEAQLVVYQCDFHQGILQDATELNDRGLVRLQRLAEMMDCGPFTLAVEEVPGDEVLSRAPVRRRRGGTHANHRREDCPRACGSGRTAEVPRLRRPRRWPSRRESLQADGKRCRPSRSRRLHGGRPEHLGRLLVLTRATHRRPEAPVRRTDSHASSAERSHGGDHVPPAGPKGRSAADRPGARHRLRWMPRNAGSPRRLARMARPDRLVAEDSPDAHA